MSTFSGTFGGVPAAGGGGGGVTQYATVAELLDASEAGLAAGIYEVPDVVIVEWDGLAFSQRLSRIQDHLADVAIWLDRGRQVYEGAAMRAWPASEPTDLAVGYADRTAGTIGASDAVTFSGTGWTTADRAGLDVAGSFELFSTIQLANNVSTNTGVAGKWSGSSGWILLAQDFASPNGVGLLINNGAGSGNVVAQAPSRLGTAPHVVHARYDAVAQEITISVDGVDLTTVSYTGGNVNNAAALGIGSYQGSTYGFAGTLAHFAKINKLLTIDERAGIVAEMLAEIS